ncbi:hypothetical protein BSPWISOXPB_5504 [uncultured Gammaproteobacteria bacterium]|nr:hypothetical protein BSPWISOXPB_5504 [uncultured Gammaproteobacteria bacterium]
MAPKKTKSSKILDNLHLFCQIQRKCLCFAEGRFEWGAFFGFDCGFGVWMVLFLDLGIISISQLENADPNAEMIVRELEMFSTILKKVASDNTKNLTVATNSYEKYC